MVYTCSLKEKPFWAVKRCNRGSTVPSQVYDELKPVSRSHFRRRNKWILIKCLYLRTQRMKIVLFATQARNYSLPLFRKLACLVNGVASNGYYNVEQLFYSDVYFHYKNYIQYMDIAVSNWLCCKQCSIYTAILLLTNEITE
jgi:hypothetical protein